MKDWKAIFTIGDDRKKKTIFIRHKDNVTDAYNSARIWFYDNYPDTIVWDIDVTPTR
jgi:hypothetical protein